MKRIIQIAIVILSLLPLNLFSQGSKDAYTSSSVLSSGIWFKMGVTTDGIYRIDYSRLVQMGLANPSNPKIYSNNKGQLSYYNDGTAPDDLKEIALYISTGSDGVFNDGDYLLFFGKATHRWKYNKSSGSYDFLRHNYSDTSFYFITSGGSAGKRVTTYIKPTTQPSYSSSESDALFSYENENVNIIKSGREWVQKFINLTINPGFTDLVTSEKIKYRIRVGAASSVNSAVRLYEGPALLKSIQIQAINIYDYIGVQYQISDSIGTLTTNSTSPVYDLKFYSNGESGLNGLLDYVRLQARASNTFYGATKQFTDSRSTATGRITEFTIRSSVSDTRIWDVTDPENCTEIQYTRSGNDMTFTSANDSLKTFIAFSTTGTLSPVFRATPVTNQNIHASADADMIILTHPDFLLYASKLAEFHQANDGLSTIIVTPEQIYNEFSGGSADIAALRNFVRMKYLKQKSSGHPLKYLLLFGDGSFDNKLLPPLNPNFIPTYQTQNSNIVVSSFMSDDFYGLLDDGEGEADGTEDIGIGRLPVSDTTQAGIMLDKIRKYNRPAFEGDWRNVICLTADDEDANTHMSDAEGLAKVLADSFPSYHIDKIYLDAFRQTTTVTGQTYPEVNKAIDARINSGCLIFNYTGHGSETGLAHEAIMKTEDINSWKNDGKLPLFITATCEFSRFDDLEPSITSEKPGKPSAGELVLLKKDGGAIALMSTTRVVYSAPNYFLNKNIFSTMFRQDKDGNPLRLGDIIRIAKNNSGNGTNKRNFSLLGDPALTLSYPWHGKVITDSINSTTVVNNTDTLKALSYVTVSGHISDYKGSLKSSFNGIVSPVVYDKAARVVTLANDGGPVMEFRMRNNILFSGKTMAKNGMFNFSFIVPRDIDYAYGTGLISYYASNNSEDMNGSFGEIIVGGFSNSALTDKTGPEIKIFMNDTLFRKGGITDKNPVLLALIKDPGGINTTGAGIGHDLVGYLDNDRNTSIVLNNYFENDFDNYKSGKLYYNLAELKAGQHTITLKAWDNYNNSSEETLIFFVEGTGKFVLKNILNYPNPFLSETKITAQHNRPDSELDVTLNIFGLDGRVIKSIQLTVPASGYSLPPIEWDGTTDGGKRAGRGLYSYTIIVKTSEGETSRLSGRMIIL